LGGNDLLRGIDPAASRANLQAILAADRRGVPAMLVGLPAPGNYGPEFRDAFEAMYPDLSRDYDAPLYPNLLQPISEKYELGLSYSDLMQDDHLHPSAEGVAAIVEGLGPVVAAWLEGLHEERPDS
jgi:acyl-CoA thioesterase I